MRREYRRRIFAGGRTNSVFEGEKEGSIIEGHLPMGRGRHPYSDVVEEAHGVGSSAHVCLRQMHKQVFYSNRW